LILGFLPILESSDVMIDITPWLAPNEVVIVQIEYWAVTKITSLGNPDIHLYLMHFCAKNRRKQKGQGIDAQAMQGQSCGTGIQCYICGSKIPERVKVTYNFITL